MKCVRYVTSADPVHQRRKKPPTHVSQNPHRFFLILSTEVDSVLFSDFCFTSFFLSLEAAPEDAAAGGVDDSDDDDDDDGGFSRLGEDGLASFSRLGAFAMLWRRSISSRVSSTLSSSWLMGWMCRSESEFMRTKGFGGSFSRDAAAAAAEPPRSTAGSEACLAKAAAAEAPAELRAATVDVLPPDAEAAAAAAVVESTEAALDGILDAVAAGSSSFFLLLTGEAALTVMIGAGGRGGLGGRGGEGFGATGRGGGGERGVG